jgi:hypothetical protein
MTPFEKLTYLPEGQPFSLPPGHDVALVKLQDDEGLVQKTALLIAGYEAWPARSHQYDSSAHYIAKARNILAMIDDLHGQRVYVVTMPKSDDAATLRAMFGVSPEDHDYYVNFAGHEKPFVRDFALEGLPRVNEIVEIDDKRFRIIAENTVINGRFASTTFDIVECPPSKF